MHLGTHPKFILRFMFLEGVPKFKELRNILEEHFGEDLNIYTEQDLYEQSRKIIQSYKKIYLNHNYRKFYN